MTITFAQVKAKLAADEAKRQRVLELRRGYDRAGRERERKAKAIAESGVQDLPPEVAVGVEESLKTSAPEPTPEKPADATGAELVAKLVAIRERIFRLSAMFAVSLSSDNAMEANRYLALFQTIAQQLEEKDASALANITRGFESLLMSPPFPTRRTIPLDTQKLVELRWDAMQSPRRREPKPPAVSDGLDWLVG